MSAATGVVVGRRGSAILLALFMLLLLEVLVAGLFWTLRVEARAGLESLAGARAAAASEAALVAARDLGGAGATGKRGCGDRANAATRATAWPRRRVCRADPDRHCAVGGAGAGACRVRGRVGAAPGVHAVPSRPGGGFNRGWFGATGSGAGAVGDQLLIGRGGPGCSVTLQCRKWRAAFVAWQGEKGHAIGSE